MADVITAPFDRVSDVNVVVNLQSPSPKIGFGNICILTVTPAAGSDGTGGGVPNVATDKDGLLLSKTDPESQAVYKEYGNFDAIALDYPETTDIYRKAASYFAQKNPSDRLAVLSYPAGKILPALKNFWFNNFYFAVFDKPNPDDEITASNIFEINKSKFLVTQSVKPTDYASWEGNDYTVNLVHPMNEAFDTAFLGRCASSLVGSINWKFKQLIGITPQELTASEKKAIDQHHGIVYVDIADVGETSAGWTSSGQYIDQLHGDIWIKTMIQYNVQKLLQNNDKIAYEQSGINLIQSVVNNTLEQAYQQGIILTNEATKHGDYSVTASSRDVQSLVDLSARRYGGIQFTYHRAGAIDSVTITGLIKSDTIAA
jgi:hypothetical protein